MSRKPSKRNRDYEAELDAITPELFDRSKGRCEVGIPGVCRGKAESRHHRLDRGQGGPNLIDNLLHLCGSGTTGCHGYIEHHRKESYRKGWLLKMGTTDFSRGWVSYP
jgi:hypothetical protein